MTGRVQGALRLGGRHTLPRAWRLLAAAFLALLTAGGLSAQEVASPPEIYAHSAVLVDAATGTLLYAKNPDEPIPPASLTKLVTMHVALNGAAERSLGTDSLMTIPPESWAANQPPRSSLMWLGPDQIVTLKDLLLGLAIPSGNDAAVAVALNFAPTVEDFVALMNGEARRLGLSVTRFVEPSGISEENMTSAREFCLFCRSYLASHPETLSAYHAVPDFSFPRPENLPAWKRARPDTRTWTNHLAGIPGADGLKTGYIDEAGYNLALTAEQDGTRFLLVLLGVSAEYGSYWGPRYRDDDGRKLLAWAFENFHTLRPEPPVLEPVRLWKGKANRVPITPAVELTITAPAARGEALTWEVALDEAPLIAPLPAAVPIGTLILSDSAGELRTYPLVTTEEAEQAGFWKRLWHSILLFFR